MIYPYQVPSGVYVLPQSIGQSVRATAREIAESGEKASQEALLYSEKLGGFACGTCAYVTAVNATHGRCKIVQGIVHLEEGCCVAWLPDPEQLHLYREPQQSVL